MSTKKILEDLRRIRQESAMSQLDLAVHSGYSSATITFMETGRSSSRLTTVVDIANALDHKLIMVPIDQKVLRRKKQRENLYYQQIPEFLEKLALHYLELGFRGNEAGKTLGQVVRESRPTAPPPKEIPMTKDTLNIVIEKIKGYWHFFSEGWTDKIRTPYPEASARSEVVAYLGRAFPGAKIIEMEK